MKTNETTSFRFEVKLENFILLSISDKSNEHYKNLLQAEAPKFPVQLLFGIRNDKVK